MRSSQIETLRQFESFILLSSSKSWSRKCVSTSSDLADGLQLLMGVNTITDQFLEEVDRTLRLGRVNQAGKLLSDILPSSPVTRPQRLTLARLCRRCGLIKRGLRWLSPAINPSHRDYLGGSPGATELAEYAALLERKGAVKEALAILSGLNLDEAPEARFIRAQCHLALWEPEAATRELEVYLSQQLDPYQKFMAEVHHAIGLVNSNEFDKAQTIVEKAIETALANSYDRLLVTCYQLRAQIQFCGGQFQLAKADLDAAVRILRASGNHDSLLIRKWLSIIRALDLGDAQPLLLFREEAQHQGHSESVREADLYLLKLKFEQERADHLLFGSPFPAYRSRVISELGRGPSGETWIYGAKDGPLFDLNDIRANRDAPPAKVSALIRILLSDLYRPFGVGGLFAGLFPDERFDIFTSPHRVHQAVYRTRGWIRDADWPVDIVNRGEKFALKIRGRIGFLLAYDSSVRRSLPETDFVIRIVKLFGTERSFTPKRRVRRWVFQPPLFSAKSNLL
ncbi:MAG: hypothetical protein HC902_11250 [Calothrix sp. SM1_5_4]|nr:hypothetical protein [Calothrix sp. SM1_5_4]